MDQLDSAETQRLLDRARAGKPRAIDHLLEHHRPYLRRLIELRLDPGMRARVDPSDVVQDAQLEAVRRMSTYLELPPMAFRLWLRQLAFDRLLMMRRRHVEAAQRTVNRDVALPDRSSMALARQLIDSRPTPSESVSRRELAQRVHQAISRLTEADREIILMRNFEGLSNQEVARVLQVKPDAASQRYGRALLRLRKLLLQSGMGGSQP